MSTPTRTRPRPVAARKPKASPIPGVDRQAIRKALRTIRAGKTKEGIAAIEKVVLGWVVPDDLTK